MKHETLSVEQHTDPLSLSVGHRVRNLTTLSEKENPHLKE
jgi:hypothetical protein